MTSEKVVCVDDSNPNPVCTFPCGYVVRGRVYYVRGMGPTGGVQIEGRPVLHSAAYRMQFQNLGWPGSDGDVGWKRHRFRKCDDFKLEEEGAISADEDLVAEGSIR